MTATFWDDHYRTHVRVWSGEPNAVLAATATGLTPGTALDLGCGEGGDAVWLARGGWRVTAVDVSEVVLARVRALAAERGAPLRTERHDLATTFPEGEFDLVSAQFLHAGPEVLRRAAHALAPGGLLLVVDHGSVAPWSWDQDAVLPSPQELHDSLALPPGFRPERLAALRREATGPDGTRATVVDNVVLVRRC